MSEDSLTQRLQDLIPQSLDDVIRANRHELRLAFATDEELHALERTLPGVTDSQVRDTLEEWNIMMIHVTTGGPSQLLPKLLGSVRETGQYRVTSTVTAVDMQAGLIRTQNSVYRVVGPRSAGPDEDLLIYVCVWLNELGIGRYFGVPPFFY